MAQGNKDRDRQQGIGPGDREPGPDQAGPAGAESGQDGGRRLAQDVRPVEARREHTRGGPEGDRGDASRATYLLIVYVLGSIALEVADEPGPGRLPVEETRIANRRRVFDQIPAEVFPRSAAAAGTMAMYISTEQYLWGLNRLLDGVARLP